MYLKVKISIENEGQPVGDFPQTMTFVHDQNAGDNPRYWAAEIIRAVQKASAKVVGVMDVMVDIEVDGTIRS